MSTPPTLVLIPGAWHQPRCYEPLSKILRGQHNLECVAVSLPSTTGNPDATFKDDIDSARSAISSETSRGRDVVVVAHSYGGMVGNSAIRGFAKSRDACRHGAQSEDLGTGHVIGLILIASGFTLTGLCFMDPFFGVPPPSWRVNKDTGYAEIVTPPRELFYHDLPADEAEYWVSQLKPQSLKALFEGGEHAYAGWQDVPAWYIGTVQDRGLPVVMQRVTVGMARAMGGHVEHRELDTSHSPFLSQPDTTAGIILEAVEAFTKTSTQRGVVAVNERIMIPVPRLFEPLSWFKYGLPLGLGHLAGTCISFFSWTRRLFRSESRR